MSSLIGVVLTFTLVNRASKIIYIKRGLLPLFCIVFIACLIIFPKVSVESGYKGLRLWLDIVFPSLFPFFVASQLLCKSGFINIFGILLEPIMRPVFNIPGSGALAFAMGITSGYPVGASITADLRNQDYLTKNEAERLLAFSNNSGPLFIMGAVGVGMFHLPRAGYLLYISHIAACITVGIILKIIVRKKEMRTVNPPKGSMLQKLRKEFIKMSKIDLNPWNLFGETIKNAVLTMLAIGGFIIFFSVLINILISSGVSGFVSSFAPQRLFGLTQKVTEGIFCGIFEITTGTNFINGDQSAGLMIKLCTCSLVIGWAGFSVHAQVMSIISSTDISIRPYLVGKALQGIIAAFYTFIGFNLSGNYIINDSSVFLQFKNSLTVKWSDMLHSSILNSLTVLLATIILCFFTLCITKLLIKK